MSAKTITFGQMTAFLQLVNRIQGPARDLTRLAPAFVHVFTAAERLMELEEVPEEQQGEGIRMDEPCGVRLEDVSFTYDDGTEPVLNHLTFDFRPGTCTAILGETGAGKTTLVRLVLALMQPTEGRVIIYRGERREERGERIDERGEWREERGEISPLHRCNFVYVPQGNTLLSGSVRDNLLLAQPDATDDDLWRVLRMACADFVETLPQGLDTMLTEVGGGLSEGQAQRIAIARALLRDRPVMIFDEATSALDGDTERRLLANILADHRKTVLFITHRPAVVDYCDQSLTVG
jgi:ABC-type multidrug transport system fused ATPase/permease subunit